MLVFYASEAVTFQKIQTHVNTPDRSTGTLLADLVDLGPELEKDDAVALADRQRRDAQFSQSLPASLGPLDRVSAWLRHRGDDSETEGERVARGRRVITLLLALAGLLTGWVVAMALFRYDGTHPVNVMWVLAVFVGLQLITLFLFLVAALPQAASRLPGLSGLQSALVGLSPGRIGLALTRLLPAGSRHALNAFVGRSAKNRRLFGGVTRWIVLHWSQVFALMFQVGAIAGALSLVVFSDLAFGWSTTLDLGAQAVHRAASALSLPWSIPAPHAVPSLDLVESTRFFRLDPKRAGDIASASAENLTRWWPFILLSMIVYGLIPRLLTLILSARRVRSNAADAIRFFPGTDELLDRMNGNIIKTQAVEPEVQMPKPTYHTLGTVESASASAAVIDWSESGLEESAIDQLLGDTLGYSRGMLQPAGGARSLAEDQSVIDAIVTVKDGPIVVIVKAWETPMLEFLDFLRDLRRAVGERRSIVVVPTGVDNGAVAPARDEDASVWAERLETLGDPWLKFKAVAA